MAVELGAASAAGIGIEEEDKAVNRGLAEGPPLSRIPRFDDAPGGSRRVGPLTRRWPVGTRHAEGALK